MQGDIARTRPVFHPVEWPSDAVGKPVLPEVAVGASMAVQRVRVGDPFPQSLSRASGTRRKMPFPRTSLAGGPSSGRSGLVVLGSSARGRLDRVRRAGGTDQCTHFTQPLGLHHIGEDGLQRSRNAVRVAPQREFVVGFRELAGGEDLPFRCAQVG